MAKAEVILELSGIEAGVLLTILNHVGGYSEGPRAAADSIRYALNRLNIQSVGKVEGRGLTLEGQVGE